MHEAIISREEFERAQAVIRKTGKCVDRKGRDYPLKGLVRCGNCGRVMQRNGKNYYCPYSLQDKDTDCAVKERYSESELENTVFQAIAQYVSQTRAADGRITRRKDSAPMEVRMLTVVPTIAAMAATTPMIVVTDERVVMVEDVLGIPFPIKD